MMNHINIDQKKLHEINPELDFNDGAILSFFVKFSSSPSIKTIIDGGRTYFWFAHSKIIEDLPMLNIKSTHGVKKRIDKLINSGLIVRHHDNERKQMSYYGFGENYDAYISDRPTQKKPANPVTIVTPPPVTTVTGYPVTIVTGACNDCYTPPCNDCYGNRELLDSKLPDSLLHTESYPAEKAESDFEKKSPPSFSESGSKNGSEKKPSQPPPLTLFGQPEKKEKEKKLRKKKKSQLEILDEVVLPFDSEEFGNLWMAWLEYREEKGFPYAVKHSMQAALKKLSDYPEQIAVWAIEDALSGGWQGIFPDKKEYEERLRKKHQQPAGQNPASSFENLYRLVVERTGKT